MTESRFCAECACPLSPEAPDGLCDRCLLKLVLGGGSGDEEPVTQVEFNRHEDPLLDDLRDLLPEYDLVRPIGEGGMGKVFLARQKSLDRQVVIKVMAIKAAKANADEFAKRFHREARMLAKLHHPRIPTVHDYGQEADILYFVSEYVEGENLAQLLEKGPPGMERSLQLAIEICEALAVAHGNGIVHRDVKPANILLDASGGSKLADFGLAKHQFGSDSLISRPDVAMGTVHYMAPEQWKSPEDVDHRADIYSLGAVLYEMLTGSVPMGALEWKSTFSGVNAQIGPVLQRCLHPDRDQRFASVLAFEEALVELLGKGEDRGTTMETSRSSNRVLLYVDIANAMEEQRRLGRERFAHVLGLRDAFLDEAVAVAEGGYEELDRDANGVILSVSSVTEAVTVALTLQDLCARQRDDLDGCGFRVGLHQGELLVVEGLESGGVIGFALEIVREIGNLAYPGQILMTRGIFDDARQTVRCHPIEEEGTGMLDWRAHGAFEIASLDHPVAVYEVGVSGISPLERPSGGLSGGILGWRPAAGREVPYRQGWSLVKPLGEGAFGEVWLAEHEALKERRVFKFCFDADKLRSLQRELILVRVLRDTLGKREDIASLHEVQLKEAPYYLESEYYPEGTMQGWVEDQGGLSAVPLDTRIHLVMGAGIAAGAAHSVGVIHKDIKPSNIFVSRTASGEPRAILGDFGIGSLENVENVDFTVSKTILGSETESGQGSLAYMAPELHEGMRASIQSDVYALGVVLYKVVAGDFSQQMGEGWERNIDDPLLREDIATCVEADPERRFASAEALVQRLEGLTERRKAIREKEAQAQRIAMWKRLAWLGMAAAVVVGVIGYWMWNQNERRLVEVERRNAEAKSSYEKALREQAEAFSSLRDLELAKVSAGREGARQPSSDEAISLLLRALDSDPKNGAAKALLTDLLLTEAFARPIFQADSHGGEGVNDVGISADGEVIVSVGSWDKGVHVWRQPDFRKVADDTVSGHPLVQGLTPDGDRALVVTTSHLYVLDTVTGERLLEDTLPAEISRPRKPYAQPMAVFSQDGWRAALITVSGVFLVDLRMLENPSYDLLPAAEGVCGLAFSPNGLALALGTQTSGLQVWELPLDGLPSLIGEFSHGRNLERVAFESDGAGVVAANEDGEIQVWSLRQGSPRFHPVRFHKNQTCLLPLADGRRLVTGSINTNLKLMTLEDGEHHLRYGGIPMSHLEIVWGLASGTIGSVFASASADKTARIWSPLDLVSVRNPLKHESGLRVIAMSGDERYVATGTKDGVVTVWDITPRNAWGLPMRQEGRVTAMATLAPYGFTGTRDGTVRMWNFDTASVAREWTLPGSVDSIQVVEGSPMVIAANHESGTVMVVKVGDRQAPNKIEHGSAISCVEGSEDGHLLALGGQDGRVSFWELETAHSAGVWEVGEAVTCLVRGDRGTLIAGLANGGVVAGSIDTKATRFTCQGSFSQGVRGLAKSADGSWVAAIGEDTSEVRLWAAANGEEKAISKLANIATHLLVTKENKLLIALQGGEIHRWDVDTQRSEPWSVAHPGDFKGMWLTQGQGGLITLTAGGARCWDAATGQAIWERYLRGADKVAIGPMDSTLFYGNRHGEIRLAITPTPDTPIMLDDLVRLSAGLAGIRNRDAQTISVDWDERLEILDRLRQSENSLVRWMASVEDPQRSISPFTRMGVDAYIQQVCQASGPSAGGHALLELAHAAAGSSESMLDFAERFLTEFPDSRGGGSEIYFSRVLSRAVRLQPDQDTLDRALAIAQRGLDEGWVREDQLLEVLRRSAHRPLGPKE